MHMRLSVTNAYLKIVIRVVAVCLLALAATVLFVFTYTPDKLQHGIYRDDKLNTYLGSLPQPVKIFENKQNEFIAVTRDGEHKPLNKIPVINSNENSEIYFDKYGDRVFYHQGHHLKVYDIQEQNTRSLPYRGGSMKDHEIAGVYKDRLMLQLKSGQVGPAKFTSYDLENNQLIDRKYDADRINSGLTVVTAFTMSGTRYHLYAEARKKHIHAASDTLSVYLDQKGSGQDAEPLSYQGRGDLPSVSRMIFNRGGGAGSARVASEAKLLLRLPSRRFIPFGSTRWMPYRVRNVYTLGNQQVAVEVDDRLVVVDVQREKATSIEGAERVQQILKEAELLAPPTGLYEQCDAQQHAEPSLKKGEGEFVFCLE